MERSRNMDASEARRWIEAVIRTGCVTPVDVAPLREVIDLIEWQQATLAKLPKLAPTGEEYPTCSVCNGSVLVHDDCEWEDGDICDRCAHTIISDMWQARDAAEKARQS
jgi:hypothetical protein